MISAEVMRRPIRILDVLTSAAKALLIAAAIVFLMRYFGDHVREAGGSTAANTWMSDDQAI